MSVLPTLSTDILAQYPPMDVRREADMLRQAMAGRGRRIVVLDDDPTGIQTVHGVSVYTDWMPDSLFRGFREKEALFFVLTNSRSFSTGETERAHEEIARNLIRAAQAAGEDFDIISRGDSTLRGHYPLETETLRRVMENAGGRRYDGEVILPFFPEGGRYTIGNIHYVREQDRLVPAGQTEFAQDRSFAFRSSDLTEWCSEKTGGRFSPRDMTCISLDELRGRDLEGIQRKLEGVSGFQKIIVNAVSYSELTIFALACARAMAAGKEFLFRSAAAFVKVFGCVPDRRLLTGAELADAGNTQGGIVLVGSHVDKTTEQLKHLESASLPLDFMEFNQHAAREEGGLERETDRVAALVERALYMNRSAVVYTRRQRMDIPEGDADAQLRLSVRISQAVTGIVARLTARPAFVVAKGGITSSDVGVNGLRVRRARVIGQIHPGVPVWMTGAESRFPGMPYVIFPGNVGGPDTLTAVVEAMICRSDKTVGGVPKT